MTYRKIPKSASWTPQIQKKTPSFAPPPIVVQRDPVSGDPEVPMPEYKPLPPDYKVEDHPLLRQFNRSKQIQTKLTIGKPGDKYEKEADSIARKVVNEIERPVAQPDAEKTELQRKPAMSPSLSYLQRMSPKNAHISPFADQVQRKENGMTIFRDIDPGQVASGNTRIKTADIDLEKIAHDFVYERDLKPEQKESLEAKGFKGTWKPDGRVTNAGKGVNYGILVPNAEGKEAGKVPILAFRGTSDLETTLQDLDWNSPGHGGFQSFLETQFARIDHVLNTFAYNKVDVTGHSLGGALAQHFTGSFPEKVRRLVTFQSAAPHAAQYQEAVDSVGENGPEIVHHVAKGDVVDLVGGRHLRGTFYEHSMKGFLNKNTPLSHTRMLLNSADIGGGEGEHEGGIKVYENATRPYNIKSPIIEAGRLGASPGGKLALGGVKLALGGVDNWKRRGKIFGDWDNWNRSLGAIKMAAGGVGAYLGGVGALVTGGAGLGVGAGVSLAKAGHENWKKGGLWNRTKGLVKMAGGGILTPIGAAVGAVGGAGLAALGTVGGAVYGLDKGGGKLIDSGRENWQKGGVWNKTKGVGQIAVGAVSKGVGKTVIGTGKGIYKGGKAVYNGGKKLVKWVGSWF